MFLQIYFRFPWIACSREWQRGCQLHIDWATLQPWQRHPRRSQCSCPPCWRSRQRCNFTQRQNQSPHFKSAAFPGSQQQVLHRGQVDGCSHKCWWPWSGGNRCKPYCWKLRTSSWMWNNYCKLPSLKNTLKP